MPGPAMTDGGLSRTASTEWWIIRANLCPSGQVSPRRDFSVVATATAYLHRLIGLAVIHSPLVPTNKAKESSRHDAHLS
jgi:hypothetical protein